MAKMGSKSGVTVRRSIFHSFGVCPAAVAKSLMAGHFERSLSEGHPPLARTVAGMQRVCGPLTAQKLVGAIALDVRRDVADAREVVARMPCSWHCLRPVP
jgi:hypothetical protein